MNMIRRNILAVFLLAGMTCVAWADEGELDRLPLGSSPLRLQLAAVEPGKMALTASGKEADLAALVEQALKRDLIVIGEYHDNWQIHQFQAEFIAALAAKYPKLVVGFEFFERGQDQILEAWRTGKIDEAALIEQAGWYKRSTLNFGYTRPVTDVLRRLSIPAIGLNVPRELIRRVSRQGFASLAAEEKGLFPGWQVANADHEFYIRSTFGPIAVQAPEWFAAVYGSQKCWDCVMAESMRRCLARPEFRGHKGVIIVGSGHVAYGVSIPFRYRLQERKAKIFSVVPVYVARAGPAGSEENPMMKMLARSLKPSAIYSRGIADAVVGLERPGRPHFPEPGFSGRMGESGYAVTSVAKEGLAEQWGLRPGDVIISVDDQKILSEEQLRALLAQKNWDDAIRFGLQKKVEIK
jgi:uncharacterized iron-regulated protein